MCLKNNIERYAKEWVKGDKIGELANGRRDFTWKIKILKSERRDGGSGGAGNTSPIIVVSGGGVGPRTEVVHGIIYGEFEGEQDVCFWRGINGED